MKYRELGKTGLKVSVLGYGASPLGGVFRDVDEAEGVRTVHAAIDVGINFIDVSPYYGITRAETVALPATTKVENPCVSRRAPVEPKVVPNAATNGRLRGEMPGPEN